MTSSDDCPSPKGSHLPRGPWTLPRETVEARRPQRGPTLFLAAGPPLLAATQEGGGPRLARCPGSLRSGPRPPMCGHTPILSSAGARPASHGPLCGWTHDLRSESTATSWSQCGLSQASVTTILLCDPPA